MTDRSHFDVPAAEPASGTPGIVDSNSKTLLQLVHEIECKSDSEDRQLLATAELVRELKARIEAGEAGQGVKWTEWGLLNFKMKKTKLYGLVEIGCAPNPQYALERYRLKQQEADKRKKIKRDALKAVESDPVRKELIEWARRAKIDKVKSILKAIRRNEAAACRRKQAKKEKGV